MTDTNTTAISLKLLAEDKTHDNGVSKNTTFRVNPDKVHFEEGFNVRTQDDAWDAHVDRLYISMKNGASIPAIDVRVEAGKILVVDGHSRVTAARKMKLEVPEYTLEARNFRGNEQDRILHMLGTGSGQKPLSPLESGIGYLRLVKFGMSIQAVADKIGVSRVTIENGLTLAEAPKEVQDMIRDGDVSSTTAREAVKAGPDGVEALKAAVAEEKANPTPTKRGRKSKKKKVTAKKLGGTAAAKKHAKKKGGKSQTVPEWNKQLGMNVTGGESLGEFTKSEFLALASEPAPASTLPDNVPMDPTFQIQMPDDSHLVVTVNREQARHVVEFLKANAPDDATALKAFAGVLELAMM